MNHLVFIENSGKSCGKDSLSWKEVAKTLQIIREGIKSESHKSVKYTSYTKYREDTFKHIRKEVSPTETFKMPVTYGQNYGFHKFVERDLNDIHFPKRKSEETKFAESMLMTGKQFI